MWLDGLVSSHSVRDLQVISLQFCMERFHLIPWQPEEMKRPGSLALAFWPLSQYLWYLLLHAAGPPQKKILNLVCSLEIAFT